MMGMDKGMGKGMMGETGMESKKPDMQKLITSIGEGLGQLAEAVNSTDGMDDSDKEAIQEIMAKYIDFVQNKMAGGDSEEPEMESEPMAMNQGKTGIPMGPQTRA